MYTLSTCYFTPVPRVSIIPRLSRVQKNRVRRFMFFAGCGWRDACMHATAVLRTLPGVIWSGSPAIRACACHLTPPPEPGFPHVAVTASNHQHCPGGVAVRPAHCPNIAHIAVNTSPHFLLGGAPVGVSARCSLCAQAQRGRRAIRRPTSNGSAVQARPAGACICADTFSERSRTR
jgi:hypothetical protein